VVLEWVRPEPAVAPGQSVVLYDIDDRRVLGGGLMVESLSPAHRR